MSRSIRVAPEHKQRVKVALRRHGFPSQKALAEKLGISRSTTDKFFTGKPIDYSYFVEISERLGLDWQAIASIEDDPPPPPTDTPPEGEPLKGIDWRQICRDMLDAQNQRRLTTNPLTTGDGVAFELDEIYVPLGLVERKQRDKRSGDISPEQGSRLYEPEAQDEIVQTFQQDEFFEQVLRQGRSRRIAIIGEPGAGKTTLLQKIAAWVLDNTEDVPIWISLADLQGKSLEQYLLQDWLKAATRKVRVTEAMQEALGELFNSGRVWLLLDAVDEMVSSSGNALAQIANQLTGWVADAKAVLTCRLNVWDAGKNALEAFDTYRNLDFSYGDAQTSDQVGQFIRRWFKSKPELAERLRTELDQTGRERIKDAVKNPLRLALLCRTWTLAQGRLPTTKAGLYQQFTEALYEWKQDRFPTSSTQRQELNRALGELAKRAIASEKTKFRLRHRLVREVLGNPDADLFQLALQLGWLNQVGVAAEAENWGEKVYAFYHPTFQEYLAAQAIDDWHYFLNHTPHNPAQGTYRIFEPQWKEVILLWLGREDVPHEQKEAFIRALVEFEDGCKDFYNYRAYFLAAAGIAEFGDCSIADEIVAQIVKWAFGYFNIEKQKWVTFPKSIEEVARATLLETECNRAILALEQLIKSAQNEDIRWQAANTLEEIGTNNPEAIAVLVQLIESNQDELTCSQTADSLEEIITKYPELLIALRRMIESNQDKLVYCKADCRLGEIGSINTPIFAALVQLIESNEDESICMQVAEILGKIAPGNETAIAALVQLIKSIKNEDIRWQAASSLGKIGVGNPEAISALVQLIQSTKDESTLHQAASSLGKIGTGNPEAISALVQLIESARDEFTRREAIYSLVKIGMGNPEVIAALMQLIESTEDESTLRRAAESLGKIDPGNPDAIAALVQHSESTENEYTRRRAAESLGTIGTSNPEAIAALVQLIELTKNEYTLRQAIYSLGEIGTGNEQAIKALVQLIESTEDEFTLGHVFYSLGKIGKDNPAAIAALEQLIESTEDEFLRRQATESLGKIDPGNQIAIATLVQLIESAEDESSRWQAAESLKKILRTDQLADIVTVLKDYLSDETYKNDFEQFRECYKVIWHCAQNMSYPTFYQAWYTQSTPIHPEVLETSAVGSTPFTQSLNLSVLPQILAATIANDPTLSQTIHLICIDGSKFIDRDNPAPKIYAEMVKAGCPKCEDGIPKTMQELQFYWDLLESNKRVVLVFYEGTPSSFSLLRGGTKEGVGFRESFLDALSKFDGAIAIVTSPPAPLLQGEASKSGSPTSSQGDRSSYEEVGGWGSLQCFSSSQPQLIEAIAGWIRAILK
jgi:HEAT repeat protein/transcriptional regulator with XRE-family HTH domain/ABC-type dipeptide/oligopeptide/nickel transport system ATPase subunit